MAIDRHLTRRGNTYTYLSGAAKSNIYLVEENFCDVLAGRKEDKNVIIHSHTDQQQRIYPV